jgi:hypothetical protein
MARPLAPVRLALGFAVAPFVVPLAWIGFMAALGELPDLDDPASVRCAGFVLDLGIVLAVGHAATLVVGGPIVLALGWLGRATVPWVVALAAVAGGAGTCAALAALLARNWVSAEVLAYGTLLGLALAAVVAAVFCAVAGAPLRGGAPPRPTSPSSA